MLPKIIKLINNTKAIFKIDSEPTKGSNNLVTSGGVYKALESSSNSTPPIIRLKEGWDSGSSTTKDLEDITLNALPIVQHYSGTDDEYLLQLPSFWVFLPINGGARMQTIFCILEQVSNPGSGELFIWKPSKDAPFTQIEARRGLGSSSWRWFIELPSSSESEG